MFWIGLVVGFVVGLVVAFVVSAAMAQQAIGRFFGW